MVFILCVDTFKCRCNGLYFRNKKVTQQPIHKPSYKKMDAVAKERIKGKTKNLIFFYQP